MKSNLGVIEEGGFKGRKIIIPASVTKDQKWYFIEVPNQPNNFQYACLVHEIENIPLDGCPECV